jgi:hypothetical protein
MFGLIGLIVGLIGAAFGVVMGMIGALFGVVFGLAVPLSPFLLFILVLWLLVRRPSSSRTVAARRGIGT